MKIPESKSSRHKILDFFNRILTEYEQYGINQVELVGLLLFNDSKSEKSVWMNRVKKIRESISILSFNMKKSHRTIPDSIISKLLAIRSCLLKGDVFMHVPFHVDSPGRIALLGYGCREYGCEQS